MRDIYGFITYNRRPNKYWCYLYKGEVVSPLLTGGFNAACRWIYENRPDIAADCFMVQVVCFPDGYEPIE